MKLNSNSIAFICIIAGLLVALAILAGINTSKRKYDFAASLELRQQEEMASQEHIPLTTEELLGKSVPDGENAAPLYLTAGESLDSELKKLQRPSAPPPPAAPPETYGAEQYLLPRQNQVDELHRCYVAVSPAMAIYRKAALLPFCDFHHDPANALFESTQNLDRMTAAVALLCAEAIRLSKSGHPDNAMSLLASLAPLAAHAGATPTLYHTLAAVRNNNRFLDAASEILSSHGKQPGVAEATTRLLNALGPLPDLVRTVEGENLSQFYLLQPKFLISDKPVSTGDKAIDARGEQLGQLARRPGMIDLWRAVQLRSTRELVATLRATGENRAAAEKDVTKEYLHFLAAGDEYAYIRNDNVSDMWREIIDKEALCLSERRILAQASATFAEWNRSGKVPDSLPLAGPDSRDPLGDGRFHYKHTVKGFTIYGVGPYGVDHGGKRPIHGQHDQDCDVVFTYPAFKKMASQSTASG